MKRVLGLALMLCACSGGSGVPLMTWEEYEALAPEPPCVLSLEKGPGALLYFGSVHTSDPDHAQFRELDSLWVDFAPSLALSEGGVRPLEPSRREAALRHEEAGLVRFLAERDRVPVQSLEPERTDEVDDLLRRYPPEKVKLFYVLRQVVQHRRMAKESPLEETVTDMLSILQAEPGLKGGPRSVEEVDSLCRRLLDDMDWRSVPETWFYPNRADAFTNEIARHVSRFRDEHMVRLLTRLVDRGDRVFAVVGFSHVVRQERSLKQALKPDKRSSPTPDSGPGSP